MVMFRVEHTSSAGELPESASTGNTRTFFRVYVSILIGEIWRTRKGSMRSSKLTIQCGVLGGCASASFGNARLNDESRVSVQVVFDEAETALAILEKESAGNSVTEAGWQRLFGSEGYRRLKERETALRRAFTDAEFRSFIQSATLVRRTPRFARHSQECEA